MEKLLEIASETAKGYITRENGKWDWLIESTDGQTYVGGINANDPDTARASLVNVWMQS